MSVRLRNILAPKAEYHIGQYSKVKERHVLEHVEEAPIDESFMNLLSNSDTALLQRYLHKQIPKSIRPNGPKVEDMLFSIGDTIWFLDTTGVFPKFEVIKISVADDVPMGMLF